MSARSDRRWEELARDLEFTQLQELRKQAEGWRVGFAALTGLLAALVVLKGRDNLSGLPQVAGYFAMGLTGGAFVLLVAGSLMAVRAASGWPGAEIVLGGQALRRWTEGEVGRVRGLLKKASFCCVLGVFLILGAVAVAWLTTRPAPTNLVRVDTAATSWCGELIKGGPQGVAVWVKAGDQRVQETIPAHLVAEVVPVTACP